MPVGTSSSSSSLPTSNQKRNGDEALQQRANKRVRLGNNGVPDETSSTGSWGEWSSWSLLGMMKSLGEIVLSPSRSRQDGGEEQVKDVALDNSEQIKVNGYHPVERHKQQNGYRRKQAMFECEVSSTRLHIWFSGQDPSS